MMELGLEPNIVSYTPETHESTDFKMARKTAANLHLNFIPRFESMKVVDLEESARYIIARGYKTKLEVECLVPMLGVLRTGTDNGDVMFTGDQSDGYFINNNWMSRNFDRARGIPGYLRTHVKTDEDPWRIDTLRDIYYEEDRSCSKAIQALGLELNLRVVIPYRDQKIREAFRGTMWSDVNLPRTKEPIKRAFANWFKPHLILTREEPVNLHRGDSLFAKTMGELLMSQPHLQGPWRTTTGLYAAIARGDV